MKLLGENIPFRNNLAFSLSRYRVWWAILVVTVAFDIFTTYGFVSKFGIKAEGNSVTKLLMELTGPAFGNVIGKILQIIAVLFFVGLHQRLGNFFLLFIILLNCWAIVINSMSLVL